MSKYLRLKRFLIGQSLPTSAHTEERLSNAAGLAVLSSDALSSVAYATEEILLVLIAAGSGALIWSLPIGLTIVGLLIVVILSYRQTIRAYPNGGGSYIVARENLGLYPGLVAGASLSWDRRHHLRNPCTSKLYRGAVLGFSSPDYAGKPQRCQRIRTAVHDSDLCVYCLHFPPHRVRVLSALDGQCNHSRLPSRSL
jgi:hypothetical protein